MRILPLRLVFEFVLAEKFVDVATDQAVQHLDLADSQRLPRRVHAAGRVYLVLEFDLQEYGCH